MPKPIVAIVGRPNVGKSTLFNRLLGERRSIVEDIPGTTRDRLYADLSERGYSFTLVDTGGLEPKPESSVRKKVKDQVEVALEEADIILFLVDARQGVMPNDLEIADMLRRSGKPVLLVVNKADNSKQEQQASQFYELGLGDPIPISAYYGRGIEDLWDSLVEHLPSPSPVAEEAEMMKIAIVGRPNVGKSMLLNAILGQERAIVDEAPGTTRDAVDTLFYYQGHPILLIDSAGIRRRGRVEQGIERYSVLRALRAIDRADVALLVTDATEFITEQDAHVAGYILQAYKGMVLIINKWDLIEPKNTAEWTKEIGRRLKFISYVPILFLSAQTGEGVEKVLSVATRVYQERNKQPPAPSLDSLIKEAAVSHPPPAKRGRRLDIRSVTQVGVNPPTFLFSVNDARLLHFSYQRYLENKLRQFFGFEGTPLRLVFKSKARGREIK